MKTKSKLFALIFALLCIAIIFMPNEAFATEQVQPEVVDSMVSLQAALDDENVTEIKLDKMITIDEDVIINGNGKTITTSVAKAFEVHGGNVEFKNVTIINSASNGRCIDVRDGDVILTLTGVTLKTTDDSSNNQTLNVGGNFEGPAIINLKNTTISAGNAGYGIITFNPVTMKVEDSKITGYAAVYLKGEYGSQGSEGSTININNSELYGIGHSEERFGIITLEDNNITINIIDSILSADIPKDSELKMIYWSALNFEFEDVEIEVDGKTETVQEPVQVVEGNVITISGQTEMKVINEGSFEIANLGTKNTLVVKEGVKSNLEIPEEFLSTGAVAKQENGQYVVYVPHDVDVNEVEGGTVTVDKVTALAGEIVTITVKADTGFELKTLKVNGVAVTGNTFTMPNEKVTVTAEFLKIIPPMDFVVSGNETENNNIGVVETEKTKETLDTSLKADTELNKKVEEERQKGNQVTVEVTMEELDNKDVKEEEKQKITESVKQNQTVHQYFDISVLVKTSEKELGKLTQLTEKMKFSMEISKDLIQEGRKFFILKLHGDKVEEIEAKLNGTKLEFETDQFSTFALAYEDATVSGDGEEDNSGEVSGGAIEEPKEEVKEEVNVPNTGDNIVLYIALALIAVVGIVLTKKVNTKKNKH